MNVISTTLALVAVQYIGREAPFIERNYGSGLSFTNGQTRNLPPELATQLLRHADVFKEPPAQESPQLVSASLAVTSVPGVVSPPSELTDAQKADAAKAEAKRLQDELDTDTAKQLKAAAEAKAKEEAVSNTRQDLVDQVNVMDKDSLKDFAMTTYGQAVPKTLSLENMRAKVVGYIDQYGLV